MTLVAPFSLEAKGQEDMEETIEEAPAEDVEVDDVVTEANHSTLILSLSATATAAAVDHIPTLTAAVEDPIPTC